LLTVTFFSKDILSCTGVFLPLAIVIFIASHFSYLTGRGMEGREGPALTAGHRDDELNSDRTERVWTQMDYTKASFNKPGKMPSRDCPEDLPGAVPHGDKPGVKRKCSAKDIPTSTTLTIISTVIHTAE
jgi:hypothetical protein